MLFISISAHEEFFHYLVLSQKITEGDPRLVFADKRKCALARFPAVYVDADVVKALHEMVHDKNLCNCGRSLDSLLIYYWMRNIQLVESSWYPILVYCNSQYDVYDGTASRPALYISTSMRRGTRERSLMGLLVFIFKGPFSGKLRSLGECQ